MDSLLNEIVEQYEMGAFTVSEAAANAPVNSGGSVGVIFLTETGEADDVRDFLLENGASPGPAFDSYVGADVPVSLLVSASQQEGVNWMHTVIPPQPAQSGSMSVGATAHGVDAWHQAGLAGEGIKIGVVSLGFDGFQSLMGIELPSEVNARCYVGYGVYS